jgi:hypothetical protein
MSQEMNHQEAFFFMLKAATAYFKYADFNAPEPTGEDLRMVVLYQNYIDELEAIGGEL